MRPDVVWFKEYLDETLEQRARMAVAQCDLFMAIGTVVYPVAGYVEVAVQMGARTVLVNLEPTANLHLFGDFYQGKAGEVLPAILRGVSSRPRTPRRW